MPDQYLTLADIASRVGSTAGALRQFHKRSTANREAGKPGPRDLPPEDIRLGLTPGWRDDTVAQWLDAHADTPKSDPMEAD